MYHSVILLSDIKIPPKQYRVVLMRMLLSLRSCCSGAYMLLLCTKLATYDCGFYHQMAGSMSVGNMILSSSRLLRVSSAKAILTLQMVIHSLHTVMWWLYWLCSVFVSMVTVTVSIQCFYGYCYCIYCSVCSGHGFSCVCVGG